eukprot:1260274-Heterocapsa_arctica.AAC.1
MRRRSKPAWRPGEPGGALRSLCGPLARSPPEEARRRAPAPTAPVVAAPRLTASRAPPPTTPV